jgi:hypothetical protein
MKVFFWLVIKENLNRNDGKNVEPCEFCDDPETQEHLFRVL